MRLSEAIALGRTAVTPRGHVLLDGHGGGCALGMAGVACGIFSVEESSSEIFRLETVFPWALANKPSSVPCECGFEGENPISDFRIIGIIAHLFDRHVMGKCDWTLDQLIDWVRSVEPAETPAPQAEQAIAESAAHCELVGKNL